MIAITHLPSPAMGRGQRTYIDRLSIDCDLAAAQHAAYCRLLEDCGAEVCKLEVNLLLPDCAFVEDTAIVLDEVAILMPMGAESRRAETAGVEQELKKHREVLKIDVPATIEGGDVLRIGRKLLIGESSRTNRAGIDTLRSLIERFGYNVISVPVRECLHLKTACCALPDGRLLVNPGWLNTSALTEFECIPVPADEPWGANFATIGESLIVGASHVRTAEQIERFGFKAHRIDLSEFSKAEAGVTCLSILIG
jgi:dimethylargininase